MKKKIIGSVAVMAIAAITAFNLNFSNQENDFQSLSLANVEALAQGEGSMSGCRLDQNYWVCYQQSSGYYCSPCGLWW